MSFIYWYICKYCTHNHPLRVSKAHVDGKENTALLQMKTCFIYSTMCFYTKEQNIYRYSLSIFVRLACKVMYKMSACGEKMVSSFFVIVSPHKRKPFTVVGVVFAFPERVAWNLCYYMNELFVFVLAQLKLLKDSQRNRRTNQKKNYEWAEQRNPYDVHGGHFVLLQIPCVATPWLDTHPEFCSLSHEDLLPPKSQTLLELRKTVLLAN